MIDAFLKLRPVVPEDEPFLRELRAQVDIERLGLRHWSPDSEGLARKIIEQQFKGHQAHYKAVKSGWDTKDCIIELNQRPVGRFIVTQDSLTVFLADIAVHPAFRGQGLGEAVIEATKSECQASRRVLQLHVDPLNPAVQFYLNLGFRAIGQDPTLVLMEWVPPSLMDRTRVFGPGKA
jgi:ribosomal protein S18 acetylase RimI-like enzyme